MIWLCGIYRILFSDQVYTQHFIDELLVAAKELGVTNSSSAPSLIW
jgi:hypothetical protein